MNRCAKGDKKLLTDLLRYLIASPTDIRLTILQFAPIVLTSTVRHLNISDG